MEGTPKVDVVTQAPKYIKLMFVDEYLTQLEKLLLIRMKYTSRLKKLKDWYEKMSGIPLLSLRFLFDGRRIADHESPETLEMEEYDTIEVFHELKCGRPSSSISPSAEYLEFIAKNINGLNNNTGLNEEEDYEMIKIRIQDHIHFTEEYHLRVQNNWTMRAIRRWYSKSSGHDVKQFCWDGEILYDTDTPKSLLMGDDNALEVYDHSMFPMRMRKL